MELEAELEQLQAAKHLAGIGLLDALKRLPDPREHQILLLRYLNHKTWAEILSALDRTEKTCMKIHREALGHLAKLMKE